MAVKLLNKICFSDIYFAPAINVSVYGDVCFCCCAREDPLIEESILCIIKPDGKIQQAKLPGRPIRGDFNIASHYVSETPIIGKDCIYFTLYLSYPLNKEKGYWIKTDLQGHIIWKRKITGYPVQSIATSTGEQYTFCYSRENSINSKMTAELTFLSNDGESLWTLSDKWLKNAGSFYILPNDLLVVAACPTDPHFPGLISRLYILDTHGEIIKRRNILDMSKRHQMHCVDVWQSPLCNHQETLIFIPEVSAHFDFPDPTPLYDPQPIALFNPLTGEFLSNEYKVAMVKAFLWDEHNRVLYTSLEMNQNNAARIHLHSGQIDYYTLPQVKNQQSRYIVDVLSHSVEGRYYHHCTPIMTKHGDVIFCNSATSLLCMTTDWKEKWSMTLPEGACDIKIQGDTLYVMIYDENEHEAVLHRFILE